MPEHRNQARGENEWSATYGNLGLVEPARLMQLPISLLDPWEDITGEAQPFDPYTPAMLADLAKNISRNGIIQPINARPRPNGRFQIIAGHNRVASGKLAGLVSVPALVQELDDDQAAILMIDSNLKTRPHILPSERARAYRLRMKKLTHQGKRTDPRGCKISPLSLVDTRTTSAPLEQKWTSRDIVAHELGISHAQVQRYLRLNDLHPQLLKMVDNGSLDKEKQDKNIPAMALRAGVELSYIPMEQQDLLLQIMLEYGCKAPSMFQAEQLRSLAAVQELDKNTIRSVMVKIKPPKSPTVKLPAERICSCFPPNTPIDQMESEIYAALLAYRLNAKEE